MSHIENISQSMLLNDTLLMVLGIQQWSFRIECSNYNLGLALSRLCQTKLIDYFTSFTLLDRGKIGCQLLHYSSRELNLSNDIKTQFF